MVMTASQHHFSSGKEPVTYPHLSPSLTLAERDASTISFFFRSLGSSMAHVRASSTDEFKVGARIKVGDAAGPRLASKRGTILGFGKYPDAVRVKLDGSKFPITLHKKYLSLEDQP